MRGDQLENYLSRNLVTLHRFLGTQQTKEMLHCQCLRSIQHVLRNIASNMKIGRSITTGAKVSSNAPTALATIGSSWTAGSWAQNCSKEKTALRSSCEIVECFGVCEDKDLRVCSHSWSGCIVCRRRETKRGYIIGHHAAKVGALIFRDAHVLLHGLKGRGFIAWKCGTTYVQTLCARTYELQTQELQLPKKTIFNVVFAVCVCS